MIEMKSHAHRAASTPTTYGGTKVGDSYRPKGVMMSCLRVITALMVRLSPPQPLQGSSL